MKKFIRWFFLSFFFFIVVSAVSLGVFLKTNSLQSLIQHLVYKKVMEGPVQLLLGNFIFENVVFTGDYLYAGVFSKLLVFDTRNVNRIQIVKSINLYERAGCMIREGSTLYVTSVREGLYIFDISNDGKPRQVGKLTFFGDFMIFTAVVEQGIIYLATNKGLLIVDARDRRHPKIIQKIPVGDLTELYISERKLYAARSGKGLLIFDVSESGHTTITGEVRLFRTLKGMPVPALEPPLDVAVVGDHAFLPMGYEGLAIVNVKNPSSPFFVKFYKPSGFCDTVSVFKGYLTLWLKPKTVLFLNISNPLNPKAVKSLHGMGFPPGGISDNKAIFVTKHSEFSIVDVENSLSPKILGLYSDQPVARALKVEKGYLYVASGSAGLEIYDLSEPGHPRLVKTVPTTGIATSVDTFAHYVYVANGFQGIDTVDVRDLQKPAIKNTFNVEQHTWGISVNENFLYAASGSRGLTIYDIKNPLKPKFVSGVKKKGSRTEAPYMLNVVAHYPNVYSFSLLADGMHVVDARNPLKLYSPSENVPAVDIAFKGKMGYVAAYDAGVIPVYLGAGISRGKTMAAYRMGGWYFKFPFGQHSIGFGVGTGFTLGVDVEGNRLFAADHKKGVLVFDIRDPLNLKKIARYRTRGHPRDIDCEGNFCYVADSEAGLATINLTTGQIMYAK